MWKHRRAEARDIEHTSGDVVRRPSPRLPFKAVHYCIRQVWNFESRKNRHGRPSFVRRGLSLARVHTHFVTLHSGCGLDVVVGQLIE
jgi:hypothetical protein